MAFLLQLTSDDVDAVVSAYGFVPAKLTAALDAPSADNLGPLLLAAVTSMFLHGGWFHIAGNLLYLRVFGDNVEDRFGHVGYILFYVGSGLAGIVAQYAVDPKGTIPMIGASGAIAGVIGAYIVMFPKARVLTLFPVFVILTFIEVPAVVFIGIWALQQFLNGYWVVTSSAGAGDGVAWFAHIGGFALGIVVALAHRIRKRR